MRDSEAVIMEQGEEGHAPFFPEKRDMHLSFREEGHAPFFPEKRDMHLSFRETFL